MDKRIHKFKQGDEYILLDVNSGAVHVIDKIIFDILETFNGTNDQETIEAWKNTYDAAEISEVLEELHELIDQELLFAPEITDAPESFKHRGIVKSLCLMISQDCNLRCKYCFGAGGTYGSRSIMTPEVGIAAVDFLLKHSPRKLSKLLRSTYVEKKPRLVEFSNSHSRQTECCSMMKKFRG